MNYPVDKLVPYDLEVYRNFFLAGFLFKGEVHQFDHNEELTLRRFLAKIHEEGYQLLGFNSEYYDDIVLSRFLDAPDPMTAYRTSKEIIEQGMKRWDYNVGIKSVDIFRILPGFNSLKKLGVMMGHHKLQELPIHYDKELTPQEMQIIRDYNVNDLEITAELRRRLQQQMDLRAMMSERYGVDLRNLGEAQIAETVLVTQAGYRKGAMKDEARWQIQNNPIIQINPPSWWQQTTTMVKDYPSLEIVREVARTIGKQSVKISNYRLPSNAFKQTVYLGDRYYSTGVGGLHSVDGPGSSRPAKGETMSDWDVASYYPAIILTQNLSPRIWGGKFLPIYKGIVEERLRAKAAGDTNTSAVLKIVINGSFGKFGDQYSALYDPHMLAHVTIYGQLGLLTLIAMLTDKGHRVISANTDGITVISPESALPVIREWEELTGMTMEETRYQALYQKDVNNYIALTLDGGIKTKGVFSTREDLRHLPKAPIIATAVQELIRHNIPIEKTLEAQTGIQPFIIAATATRGWETRWGDQKLGKVMRFYRSIHRDLPEIIKTPVGEGAKGNAGRVPGSEHCIPVDDLPEGLPTDLDLQWYADQAWELYALIALPKYRHMNAAAEELVRQGLQPVVVHAGTRLSRAEARYGETDFNSIPAGHTLAVRTGGGILGRMEKGITRCLYRVDQSYPSKTRDLVERKYGLRLIYGGSIPVPPWGVDIHELPGAGLDHFYTDTELRNARDA